MGVEYQHYLIPEDNTYRPEPDDLSKLVQGLAEAGFIIRTGSEQFKRMKFTHSLWRQAAATGCVAVWDYPGFKTGCQPFASPATTQDFEDLEDRDFKIVWPVDSSQISGLKYPLAPFPTFSQKDLDVYYEIELHVAHEFIYRFSELIDPFPPFGKEVACSCGGSWR